jgi:hypothetical protein
MREVIRYGADRLCPAQVVACSVLAWSEKLYRLLVQCDFGKV